MTFTDLQKQRRKTYTLGKKIPQTPEEIFEIVKSAVKYAPTAFNNQTVRTILLTGAFHEKLWQLTADRLKAEVSDEIAYNNTLAKLNSAFKTGYGTILFFTDTSVVKSFEENVPLYAENFYDWSEQGHGIAEYATWLALTEVGLGASLQHYNPLIDEQVADNFNVPSSWRLRAQMPFGTIESPANDKTFEADENRFKLFKS